MTSRTGGRPLALVATAKDVVLVAIWALLLQLAARGSKIRVARDLF